MLLTASVARAADGDFTEPITSPEPAGDGPSSIAIGDFDGDGVHDLAVAGSASNDLTILLGDGQGGFSESESSPQPAGDHPISVAAGDLDGDSVLDLALSNYHVDQVTVLLGDGAGGFSEAEGSAEAVADGPQEVAVGDFDSDGIQDLAVAAYISGEVTVLLGDGTGDFTEAQASPIGAGTGAISLAVGDFDVDGTSDLAVANYDSDDVTILLGDGTGGFAEAGGSPHGAGDGASSVVVGDFDGDELDDLAIASAYWPGDVTILLGDGTGGFVEAEGSPHRVGDGPYSIVVGEFNGDGAEDLATAGTDAITILFGDGTGGFAEAESSPEPAGSISHSAAAADLDRDGSQDLAVANNRSDDVTILLNRRATADLRLTKTGSADRVVVGETFTYTLRVRNAGPDYAADVTLTDFLPSEVDYVDWASTHSCNETASGSGEIKCELSYVSGETAAFEIAVEATSGADPAVNTAVLSAPADPDGAEAAAETTIVVPRCAGREATIVGGPYDDRLEGTPGDDTIVGRGGDDRIDGRGGDDRICGQAGNDELIGGAGNDLLRGHAGDDILLGNAGEDILLGDIGADDLRGQRGSDRLRGGAQADTLRGGGGWDRLGGGTGPDRLRGGHGHDHLGGWRGNDLLWGGPGIDRCRGDGGRDILRGCER